MRTLAWVTLFCSALGASSAHAQLSVCGRQAQPGSDVLCTFAFAGVQGRQYRVHVPDGYTGDSPVPLVLDLHGTGSSKEGQARVSGWIAKGDQEGFVVVHADATAPSGTRQWNAGDCCEEASRADDLGFLREVVSRTAADLEIDPERIFATGLSSGGAMVHFLGCRASDVFRAIAPVSFQKSSDLDCRPAQPIGMLEFHARADRQRDFDGFVVNRPPPEPDTRFPSAPASAASWATILGCSGDPRTAALTGDGQGQCMLFDGCSSGAAAGLCMVSGGPQLGGHVLYNNNDGLDVPDVVWSFFGSLPPRSSNP